MYQSAAKASPSAQGAAGSAAAASPLAQRLNASPRAVAQRALAAQLNRGGLPENLRNGVERLSGVSMAGVNVHYNSAKPAQLNAEAYAQGRDIHLAPGKAHHLPHEAWHVAQQAQGRVKPTMQLQKAVPINDDKRLEKEADELGKKAATLGNVAQRAVPDRPGLSPKPQSQTMGYTAVGGKNIRFDKTKYPREKFKFGANTRYNVLSQDDFNPGFYDDGTIAHVRSATGQQVHAAGVQLDHSISWDKISEAMQEQNFNSKYIFYPKYTLWEARMYYNDTTNLHPVLAADNAAAGAQGVQRAYALPHDVGVGVANVQTAWMDFQSGLHEVAQNLSADEIENISSGLGEISERIEEGTDTYF